MSALFSLLPIVLCIGLFTALVKLSAFVYRRTDLRWKHALAYAVLVLVASAVVGLLHKAIGSPLPVLVMLGLSLAIQMSLGAWYLGAKARTNAGVALAFRGGATLAAVGYVVIAVVLVLPAVVYFAVHGTSAA